jgi:hypothetical protein
MGKARVDLRSVATVGLDLAKHVFQDTTATRNCAVVACQSSVLRLPPDRRRVSGACQDTRRSNRSCATTTSSRSVFLASVSLLKLNLVEPPWYVIRMPVGVGWTAPRGADVEALMGIIRQLRGEGLAILYVSHHLEELFAIANDIVVMRDGAVVAARPAHDWTHPDLVRAMLAKDLQNAYPWVDRPEGPVLLEVKNLVAPGVRSTSFAARSGEIVGLVGLDGAGRTELLKAIAGATRPSSGSILVEASRCGSAASSTRANLGLFTLPKTVRSKA